MKYPIGFGKILLISTLDCYFRGQKDLFEGLAIADFENDWAEYPMFHIDFNGGDYTQPRELEKKIEWYLQDWEHEYGKDDSEQTVDLRFQGVLRRAYQRTGRRAVILVDKYDKPILDVLDTGAYTYSDTGDKILLEDRHRGILECLCQTGNPRLLVRIRHTHLPYPPAESQQRTDKRTGRPMGEYLLDFPNNEVRKGFLSMIAGILL